MSISLTQTRNGLFVLLAVSVLTLALVKPSLGQSCGSATIAPTSGYYGNHWQIGNQTGPIVTIPTEYGSSIAAISQALDAGLLSAIETQNRSCVLTSSYVESQNNNGYFVTDTVHFIGCASITLYGDGPYNTANSLIFTANFTPSYLCLQSGYSGSPGSDTVLSSGECYAENTALLQCGGPGQGGTAGVTVPVDSKTDGESACCTAGNPINVATGNKFQKEIDFPAQSSDSITFARYYNSDVSVPKGSLGFNWRDTFDKTIVLSSDPSFGSSYTGPLLALAYRADGRVITFNISGATPVATDPDTVETLSQPSSTTWALTTNDDTVEFYTTVQSVKSSGPSNFGQLTSIQFRDAVTELMSYNVGQNLMGVTDSFGQTLTFTYDSSNRVASMTDTVGNLYAYQYSGGYLTTAIFPGPTFGSVSGAPFKSYSYNWNPNGYGAIPYLLSGITDESGKAFANWSYTTTAPYLALSSFHGGSINADYNSLGSFSTTAGTGTTVADGNGQSSVYTFQVINGVPKSTRIVTNGTLTQTASYDTSDNLTSITDRKGNITTYQYFSSVQGHFRLPRASYWKSYC